MIKGETVELEVRNQTGTDRFHQPVYETVREKVENVVIGSPSTDAVNSDLSIFGKRLMFVLGIPKGDAHNWKDSIVYIRNEKYQTYGEPLIQTESNVPGPWNTQVKVAMYEQGKI